MTGTIFSNTFFKNCATCFYAIVITCVVYSTPLIANPTGGQVVSGQVSIQQTPGSTVIHQSSDKAIINWQSFNIGAQEATHFQQVPGGVALNRINPQQGVSEIYGRLTATGQIILINPAGIYFGPNAYVNVGGLIASTSDISNQNFLAGKYIFDQPSLYNGSIINAGTLIAQENGLIALVGSRVSNTGHIEANLGTVVLASGNKFTLDLSGNQLISFAVDEKTMQGSVENTGKLSANGGKILVTAKTAQNVLDKTINMEGVLEAKSVAMRNGEIILMGDHDQGIVRVAAKIDASGKLAKQKGGKVHITGNKVLVDNDATIDVSGDAAGGEILVGGDYLGKGTLANAKAAVIAPNARLIADAISSGDGGKIVLWSDEVSKFYGTLFARGGATAGNGGFVETSSKDYLEAVGSVDASAANGKAGLWLLDPANITISTGGTTNISLGLPPDTFTATANSAVLNNATILASLNLGTNVTVLTSGGGTQTGNVTISNGFTKTLGGDATFTINAQGTITVNSSIGSTFGALNVTFIGDAVIVNQAITTNGGNFISTTQNAITLANAISTGAGTVAINVNQNAAGSEAFTMNAGSSISTTNTGVNAVAITVNTAAGGTGTAALRSITTGSGGTVSVVTNPTDGITTNLVGGSITMPAGTINVGTGTVTLTSSQTATRAVGTSALPMQIIAERFNSTTGSGGLFVTNSGTGPLDLGTINSTGAFTLSSLSSTGITDSGTMTVTGVMTLAAGATQDIALDSAANNFGTATITSGRNVSLVDTNALILGASTVSGNYNIATGGSVTQTGALTITGTPTFTANAATSDILLATSANAFSTTPVFTSNGNIRDLSLRNTLASALVPTLPTGLRNLVLQFDSAAMALSATTLTGTLTATASGAITQLGAISGTTLTAKTLSNSGENITLNNVSNEFTTVNLQSRNSADSANAAGLIQYQDATGFNVALLRTTTDATLTSGGAMTDSGALTIGGTTTLAAGGNSVTLNTATNDFNIVTANDVNNLTLVDANAIDLAASTVGGTLGVTTTGAITQSGLLTVTGTATFAAGAANNVTLDNFNNEFSTVAVTTGNNVKIKDISALILGTSTISGTYDVTAGGSITQSGALSIAGTPTFTLTAATTDFSLASQANNFATTPIFTNNGNARDLLLRNTNASATVPTLPTGLRNLTLTFNNATALLLPGTTLTGNLSVTANGPITQSGALDVSGAGTTSTFVAGAANNITLNNANNNFATIAITSGNNVNIRDLNALILGTSTASGTLDVTTNGAITQSGTVIATGLTTLDSTNNAITLNTTTNNFSSINVLSGSNVNLRDTNALILAGILASGTLTVTTNGALTQSAPITATGLTTLAAGAANNITLNNSANDFSTVNVTTGRDVTLTDVNALALGTSTVSGLLDVTAGGSISETGILTVTGTPTFTLTTPNSDILLGTQANVFSATPVLTSNGNIRDVSLRIANAAAAVPTLPTGLRNLTLIFNSAAMALPSVSLTGALTATATGTITQTGALSGTTLTAKTLNNTAGSAPITLNTFNNDFSSIDLRVRNAGDTANVATPITYQGTGGFDIATIATGSTINLLAGNAITQTGALSGTTLTAKTLNNAGANITLTNAANALTTINLASRNAADSANAAGAISYTDASGLDIANIATTNSATLIATALTQSGAITANLLTAKTLNNAGGAILFNNSGNEVNTIDLRARNATDTANDTGTITYTDASGFDIATLATLNPINLIADGIITDSGSIIGTTLTSTAVGGMILDFGAQLTGFTATNTASGNIQLVNTGTLSINAITESGGGDFILNNTGTTTFNNLVSTGAGNTAVTSTGAVSDGTAGSFLTNLLAVKTLANAGAAITLDNANLHDASNIELSARNAADTANAAGAISYRDSNGFNVTGINTTSTVTFLGGDTLTQSGAMTGTTLTATTLNNAGADIIFNDVNNQFTGLNLASRNAANTTNTAGNLTYSDIDSINIVGLQTLGNSTISASGAITDSGVLNVGDTLAVTAIGGITLNSANTFNNLNLNNAGGAITIVNTAAPLTILGFQQTGSGAVSITNTGNLALANGVTLNTNNNALALTLTDLNLNATAAINSGTATTTITQNTVGGSIGLGNTSGTLSISGSELQRIFAGNLALNAASNGQIIVDGISVANSNNIAGTVTLTATTGTLGNILFDNATSSFKALTATADNGITINTPVLTTVGTLALNGDAGGGTGGSDAIALNANLTSAGNMTLSAAALGIVLGAPINLTANGLTISSPVTGNFDLNLNSGTGTALINSTMQIANLTIDGNAITLNGGSINTTGNQTYEALVTLGGTLSLTASNLYFNNGVNGLENLTITGLSGDNQFSFTGPIALNNVTITGSANGNNLLSVNSGSFENWMITNLNQGSLSLSGLTGNFTFSRIQNLIGGANGNTFTFADGASFSGLIDGNNLAAVNTLNYSSYASPIHVILADLFYSGETQNNVGSMITNFKNINNLMGSGDSTLTLPNKLSSLTFESAASGFVGDPINFSQFNGFITPNPATPVDFIAPAVYDTATNVLTINGTPVAMTGFNSQNFSGNISFINVPIPPVPPLPPTPQVLGPDNIASLLTRQSTESIETLGNNITVDNRVSAAVDGQQLQFGSGVRGNSQVASTSVQTGSAFTNSIRPDNFMVVKQFSFPSLAHVMHQMISAAANTTFDNFLTETDYARNILLSLVALAILSTLLAKKRSSTLLNPNNLTHQSLLQLSFSLRSNLNVIGFAELIYSGQVGTVTSKQKEYLEYVMAESNNMLSDIAKIEALKTMQLDSQVFADITFNIRTTLNNIMGFTSLITNGEAGEVSEQQTDFLNDIITGSKDILRTIPIKE